MIFLGWLIGAVSIMLVGYVVPGVHVAGLWTALIAALVLGILNIIIRPLIILLTLPVNILTLGLFTLVINAGIFLLASSIVKGFTVDGFGPAFVGAILLWLINWGFSVVTKPIKNNRVV